MTDSVSIVDSPFERMDSECACNRTDWLLKNVIRKRSEEASQYLRLSEISKTTLLDSCYYQTDPFLSRKGSEFLSGVDSITRTEEM